MISLFSQTNDEDDDDDDDADDDDDDHDDTWYIYNDLVQCSSESQHPSARKYSMYMYVPYPR